jgi:hypothetical protein
MHAGDLIGGNDGFVSGSISVRSQLITLVGSTLRVFAHTWNIAATRIMRKESPTWHSSNSRLASHFFTCIPAVSQSAAQTHTHKRVYLFDLNLMTLISALMWQFRKAERSVFCA